MRSLARTGLQLGLIAALVFAGARALSSHAEEQTSAPATATQPTKDELLKRLTQLQRDVTQHDATEPPFHNEYWDNHKAGLYVDVVSGEPLFSSLDKFDSGTGWPSFTKPIAPGRVVTRSDTSLLMERSEVRSSSANSHLGHVFDDGPAPTGQRYCINSASLRFVPVEKLADEGYGHYLPMFGQKAPGGAAKTETATFAGGCFWGMQEILRHIPGVTTTVVGYTGGALENPSYWDVHEGTTGHAESVQVTFDPSKISYADLLGYFFRMHDPTTANRQGNDTGTQYRSAIFYHSDEQRRTAERVKDQVNKSGKWKNPIVTQIVPAGAFYKAEESHQDYLQKHPDGYTCHFLRD